MLLKTTASFAQHAQLNQEQKEAILHGEGPLLVLAGAGSGKTRVVTYRILRLLERGISPHDILAVTFTNKAAEEMKERVFRLLAEKQCANADEIYPHQIHISTFHKLGSSLLRESIEALGYSPDFSIYDEEDSLRMVRTCMKRIEGIDSAKWKPKVFRNMISRAKNQLLSPEDVFRNYSSLKKENRGTRFSELERESLFTEIYSSYQKELLTSNCIDFDDLLFLTVRLLQENEQKRLYYQEKWKYLLIDEYQDTNQAQYLIAKILTEKHRNLFVVGDPDQSIYSWRGANIENILSFERDFSDGKEKKAKIIRLEQNYRSSCNILNAANALIQRNTERYEKKLWSNIQSKEKISVFVAEDPSEESSFILEQAEELHHRGGISWSDIVIFYRTNSQSRYFEDILIRKGIPYRITGGLSFYQRVEIKDLLAYLRMAAMDQDTISFTRTLPIGRKGMGAVMMENLLSLAKDRGLPIFILCQQIVEEKFTYLPFRRTKAHEKAISDYVQIVELMRREVSNGSLLSCLKLLLEKSCYFDYLSKDPETFEDRKANVEEFCLKVEEWEEGAENPTLSQFLEEITLQTSAERGGENADSVNLMSLHNGKGLEFKAVFLTGMEEDLFPHINCKQDEKGLEEERRLCYVGMTRAKQYLYLSASMYRHLGGNYRPMRLSRFIKEIPKNYIVRIY